MIEKEITETYYFKPTDFNEKGRRISDGVTFRDVVKEFERDFHERHSTEYALNLYANSQTMDLLAKSNDAAPFLLYGMDLTQGKSFDAVQDPFVNHEMEKRSEKIYVYGIDSALTLLVDDAMRYGELRLAVPTLDDGDETENFTIDIPQFEYA